MKTIEEITLYPANCDMYGNPRVIVHFFAFLKDSEINDDTLSIDKRYEIAKKRANKIGFSKYRGKDFGGGFVHQCWNETELKEKIVELVNNI